MARLQIVLIGSVFAAQACSPSKGNNRDGGGGGDKNVQVAENTGGAQTSDKDTSAGKGDDLAVEIAVPMGLVDPAYIAGVLKKLPSSLAPDKATIDLCANPPADALPKDLPASIMPDEWDACGSEPPFAYERNVTSEPGGQITDSRRALYRVQTILGKIMGPGGYFGTQDLRLATDGVKRRFVLPPESGAQFAEVGYDKASKYPFIVDLYDKLAAPDPTVPLPTCAREGKLLRAVRLEFARPDVVGTNVLVHVLDYRVDPDYPDFCKYSELTYDTSREAISFVESWDHISDGYQNKYVTNIEYAADKAIITGGVRWDMSLDAESEKRNDPRASRMEYALDGDIDLFRAVASISGGMEKQAVQQLAFLPGDQRSSYPAKPDGSIFTTNSYYDVELDHILKLLRDPTLNVSCATTGDLLRQAHATQSLAVPAALTAAPASFCAANTAFTRAAAEDVLKAVCLVDAPVTYSLGVADGDGVTGDLCEKLYHAMVLRNPQAIELVQVPDPDDATKTVLDRIQHLYHASVTELMTHVAYDTVYAALESALGLGKDFPDLNVLWSNDKWDVPNGDPAVFAGAEPVGALVAK